MNFEKIVDISAKVISSIGIAFIGYLTFRREKKDNFTSKTVTCLTDLFSEYKEAMNNINTALAQSEQMYIYLEKGDFSHFNQVYYADDYKTFREVGYFFELLGTLVKRNEIDAVSVIQYFSFPIEFFRKTKKIRDIIRDNNCLPDYWEHFRYLCAFYNGVKISTIRGWIVNGEIILLSEKELDELPIINEKHFGHWRRLAKAKKAAEKKVDKSGTW